MPAEAVSNHQPLAVATRAKPLAAAILAAGESRRMGTPKALLPYRGKTFLNHLIEVTRHPRVGITCVILGAHVDRIRKTVTGEAVATVVNADWQQGQLSSIQAAIRSLPPEQTAGLILCPVDHPIVSAALVARLIDEFDSRGKLIALPTFRGRRGHPVIFRASLYTELLQCSPEVGARQLVWAHAADVAEVPTEEEGVVLNLNDPASLARVQAEQL
jgi:CTP:molybdopterin cytidylyltransferase MocA